MLELHNRLHFLGHHCCTQKLETLKCIMSGSTLHEFNVLFFNLIFLNLFVHFSFSYLDCFHLLFCCSIFVIFLFPNPLCFSAWKSRVWCSCRLNTQLTVSLICHTHTAAGESLLRQAETREIKCDILSIGEQHPSQCVRDMMMMMIQNSCEFIKEKTDLTVSISQ